MGIFFAHKSTAVQKQPEPVVKTEPAVAAPINTPAPPYSTPVARLTFKEKIAIIAMILIIVAVSSTVSLLVARSHYNFNTNDKRNIVEIQPTVVYEYNKSLSIIKNQQYIVDSNIVSLELVIDQQLADYKKQKFDITNSSMYVDTIKKINALDKQIDECYVHKVNINTLKNKQYELKNIIDIINTNK
jgi:hypothetical protein